jgi:hypothetical protein
VVALSSIYLFIVAGHYFLKTGNVFLSAALLFILDWLMFTPTTAGARALSYVLLTSGALCVVISILFHFDPFERGLVSDKR